MQASKQLSIDQIVELIRDRTIIPEHALNPFLALVMVEQNNCLSFLIEDTITSRGDLIEHFCGQLSQAIQSREQTGVLRSLLSMTLLTCGSLKCKSKVDSSLNQQEIIQNIDMGSYSYEQQLLILHCMFELVFENWIGANQIESLHTVFDQEAKSPERRLECDRFQMFLQQATSIDALEFIDIDLAFEPQAAKKSDIIVVVPAEQTVNKESECRMRDSPATFNFFLLCLAQAHYSVQIPIFEDLTVFAKQSLRNKRIMVQAIP